MSNIEQQPEVVRVKDCLTDVFCEYPGGDYLNALYEGKWLHFYGLDQSYTLGWRESAEMMNIEVRSSVNPNGVRISALPKFIEYYLNNYAATSSACLGDDFSAVTVESHSIATNLVNEYGVVLQRYPAIDISKTVLVKREMGPYCEKFCSTIGANNGLNKVFNRLTNNADIELLYDGLNMMMRAHKCDSPEIKKFENNLMDFARSMYM